MATHKTFDRAQRLEGQMRACLAESLQREVNDPRLEGVIVSAVRLNKDKTHAVVYFSVIGGEEKERQAADGFQAAASFLRRDLGRRLRVRSLPTLEFERDTSYEYGDRLERLFDRLHNEGTLEKSSGDTEESP